MKLGVCYYPEQWPEAWWADDATRMRAMGISYVRLAEFSWALIEPQPGVWNWAWLDRAIETLHRAGLWVVMCTPTATPPKWLIDANPEVLAVDANGVPRHFGSRRHYCFSSPAYRVQSQRITREVAVRYGAHPAVAAWQTDNEYGCHDTVMSYSRAARGAFRAWLLQRYRSVDALNAAWGTTFWSQCYTSFDQIDPPIATVTEANPSHRQDWQRFASDEVVAFNREQVEILRAHSPGRPVSHNFMGFFTGFNHHAVAADLDIATWDSYPLGFTQMFFLTDAEKERWADTGHPDIPAFHHDIYRGMCIGKNARRWWVMEQQPGPVNWAHWNSSPADGMVRLWTWQAFAHGAEVVSYFRWRQAPFAQEQMHTGLLRPDRSDDQGAIEASEVGRELAVLAKTNALTVFASVALVFDYDAIWMQQIQPQGRDYNPLELSFRVYSELRQMALTVDIVGPHADLSAYRLIVLPTQMHVSPTLLTSLSSSTAQIIFGPRAGSKTEHFQIPANLAPGVLSELTGVSVRRVSSLPPGVELKVTDVENSSVASRWREDLALTGASVEAHFADGKPAIALNKRVRYVAAWLSNAGWSHVLARAAGDAGLAVQVLPDTLRVHESGDWIIACNFSADVVNWRPLNAGELIMGSEHIPARGVSIWSRRPASPGAANGT